MAHREPEGPEPRKWKQIDEFVESHELTSFRPYLVLQKAEHESFEEIEHLDELKGTQKNDLETERDAFGFKLWCPHCKCDLSADLVVSPSSESFSQYATARSRSSSASSYIELASLSSEIAPEIMPGKPPERTPERPPIRRFSTQSNQSKSPSMVISPRFSSITRKSVREKQTAEKAAVRKTSSAILDRQRSVRKSADKSSSPSIDSRSKTTTGSNSTTVSIAQCSLPNFVQYNVETYLKKNPQTGSIKQLTVIRYNEQQGRAEGARRSVKRDGQH